VAAGGGLLGAHLIEQGVVAGIARLVEHRGPRRNADEVTRAMFQQVRR
jgi:hypothetical protein